MDVGEFLMARLVEDERDAERDRDATGSPREAVRRADLCRARRELAIRLAAERRARPVAEDLLHLLAQPYAHHPEYDPSWRRAV